MRLINVEDGSFHVFFHDAPPYAILSHTWGPDELTFDDWKTYIETSAVDQFRSPHVLGRPGYDKIKHASRQAKSMDLSWVWCDTVCINKDSSSELSEAINSMFAWYRDAAVCFAYLEDVSTNDISQHQSKKHIANDPSTGTALAPLPGFSQLRSSRWFTRGWTLQELLAPEHVIFFDRNWAVLGTKKELSASISDIASIHVGALTDRSTIWNYSIAQRMSWASNRQTTRPEDIAYCLLGVFQISMPMLYGEGSHAFRRLQEEIIKVSNDLSILAWDSMNEQPSSAVLAQHPAAFRLCYSIVQHPRIKTGPYTMTNLGISTNIPIIQMAQDGTFLAGLNCARVSRRTERDGSLSAKHFQIWIHLHHTSENTYERLHLVPSYALLLPDYVNLCHVMRQQIFFSTTPSSPSWGTQATNRISNPAYDKESSSGFILVTGFGRWIDDLHTFDLTYAPSHITRKTVKPRRRNSISHEIIRFGHSCILLSAVWDEMRNILGCMHTILCETEETDPETFRSDTHLVSLLDSKLGIDSFGSEDPVRVMNSFHETLRSKHVAECSASSESWAPLIEWQKMTHDATFTPEIIVRVIFKEPPPLTMRQRLFKSFKT